MLVGRRRHARSTSCHTYYCSIVALDQTDRAEAGVAKFLGLGLGSSLDRFLGWGRDCQDILYDYKAELTGVGNRSQIQHCIIICIFALFIFRLH